MNYNKVILAGNVTRNPELSYLPSQTAVCKFGMAVNRKYKTKDGQQKEEILFIDCTAWGKSAETIQKYVKKGSGLLVDGRLRLEQWQAKDGTNRSRHSVTVEAFQFVGAAEKPVSSTQDDGYAHPF